MKSKNNEMNNCNLYRLFKVRSKNDIFTYELIIQREGEHNDTPYIYLHVFGKDCIQFYYILRKSNKK